MKTAITSILVVCLLGIGTLFSCKSLKKNVNRTSVKKEVETTKESDLVKLEQLSNYETTQLRTFSSEDDEFDFEITGPAVISVADDGSHVIESTSENTVVKAKRKSNTITHSKLDSSSVSLSLTETDSTTTSTTKTDETTKVTTKEIERKPDYMNIFITVIVIGLVLLIAIKLAKKWLL